MNIFLRGELLSIDPFATEDDIEEIRVLSEWDILFVFKDGRKILYDRYTKYNKNISYDNINELTQEQENKEFAYMLRSLMGRRGITQEELAEKIGITRQMIGRYVRGETMPNLSVANKMRKVLNCSLEDFFNKNY